MTRTTNARLAGCAFLFYIATGITSMTLAEGAHAKDVLALLMSLCALTLGVTLYAITRDEDPDLALLGLGCRFIEAVSDDQGVAPIFFAVGSTLFAWLLLRGRMIPIPLARLGVVASVLLVVMLFVQRAGLFAAASNWSSTVTWLLWLPMLVFELTLAAWFLFKGVGERGRLTSS